VARLLLRVMAPVSAPRQTLPASTYLVTRRCTQRQFLLRPSALVNQIFAYCVALAAERTGVLVHALCVLSDHWHGVLTDVQGRLPEFEETVHKLVAKCVNASLGRWENLWSSEAPSAVRLEDDGAVLDRIVYTLCNPTAAGLVAFGKEWPGLRTRPRDIAGSETVIRRPAVFFREDGATPETVVLRIVPPVIEGMTGAEVAAEIETRVAERERELRDEAARTGRSFLGRRAVLEQEPSGSPTSREPHRKLSPRVAAADPAVRIAAIARIKQFLLDYRGAFLKWKRGIRDVLFPHGTYALRLHAAVPCAPPDG